MKKEDLLQKIGLCGFAKTLENKEENRYSILDYFNGKDPALQERVLKWSFLENSPQMLKKYWAHHRYFVFVPR